MRDSKNLVIGMLCAVVCIMAVAYAAFSTTLNVNGTATISSNWKVGFTDIICEATEVEGGATSINVGEETVELAANGSLVGEAGTSTSATFDVTFLQPGDSAVCTVTVKNSGTLNAKVETLTVTNPSGGIITYVVDSIAQGDKLAAGAADTFTITATYDETEEQPEDEALSKTLVISAVYSQDLAA